MTEKGVRCERLISRAGGNLSNIPDIVIVGPCGLHNVANNRFSYLVDTNRITEKLVEELSRLKSFLLLVPINSNS